MAGANGDALEWALALMGAPAQRHALRQQPLPAGMERLLGIAGGALPHDLAEAACSFGQPEAHILEAARFYAREVLFFPQADAYRTLGVDADATRAQIKAHHRLLQHWLHPDRLQGEDDEIFAARVNAAWSQLRSVDRRRAYDAGRLHAMANETEVARPALGLQSSGGPQLWAMPAPVDGVARWARRIGFAVVLVVCIGLAVLAMRDMRHMPASWEQPDGEVEPRVATDVDGPEHGESMHVPRAAESAMPGADDSVRASTGLARNPVVAHLSMPLAAFPAPADSLAVAVAVAVPDGGAVEPRMTDSAVAGIEEAAMQEVTMDSTSRWVQPPQPADKRGTPADKPVNPERQWANDGSVRVRASTPVIPQIGSAPVQAAAVPDAPEPSPLQMELALRTGDAFMRYMGGGRQASPAIWNSPVIQSSAGQLRQELQDLESPRFSAPQWRIGKQNAVLVVRYRAKDAVDDRETGELIADLVWREGMWLVIGVGVERLQ